MAKIMTSESLNTVDISESDQHTISLVINGFKRCFVVKKRYITIGIYGVPHESTHEELVMGISSECKEIT